MNALEDFQRPMFALSLMAAASEVSWLHPSRSDELSSPSPDPQSGLSLQSFLLRREHRKLLFLP